MEIGTIASAADHNVHGGYIVECELDADGRVLKMSTVESSLYRLRRRFWLGNRTLRNLEKWAERAVLASIAAVGLTSQDKRRSRHKLNSTVSC